MFEGFVLHVQNKILLVEKFKFSWNFTLFCLWSTYEINVWSFLVQHKVNLSNTKSIVCSISTSAIACLQSLYVPFELSYVMKLPDPWTLSKLPATNSISHVVIHELLPEHSNLFLLQFYPIITDPNINTSSTKIMSVHGHNIWTNIIVIFEREREIVKGQQFNHYRPCKNLIWINQTQTSLY